ncbi:TPA: hypothetical protein QDB21_002600 [Burkholderia vietnamiensis]|nr:hypothetical protein [Burkholderia vietnamiensis]
MQHYFVLNAQHEPAKVDLGAFAFDKNIADTTVAENTQSPIEPQSGVLPRRARLR